MPEVKLKAIALKTFVTLFPPHINLGWTEKLLYPQKMFTNRRRKKEKKKKDAREIEEPGLGWRNRKSPALDGEGMRGEPRLERTGREC
ncbi:hypothetical protein TNCV_4422701 [Trichonephila clavipes]|nr:hypothetical protein TNCV_4422701 [Trichonephila clavipes]